MRLTGILLFFLAIPPFAFCGDFSSWWYKTPGGNTISRESWGDEDFVMIHCGQMYDLKKDYRRVVDHIERWYFFHNYIVGLYWKNGIQHYFIFNETDCACQTFDNFQAFEESRSLQKMKPAFWTRWYDDTKMDGYRMIPDYSLALFVLFLGVLLALVSLIHLVLTRFSLKNRINQLSLLFYCFLFLRRWLDVHPQSF